jgi:hypothetical protein
MTRMLEITFALQTKPYWEDDCGHKPETYQFTFTRTVTNRETGEIESTDFCDVYLWYTKYNKQNSICIRFGRKGDYLSTSEAVFLSNQNVKSYSLHGFVHDMLWLKFIHNYTFARAFASLKCTFRVNSTD